MGPQSKVAAVVSWSTITLPSAGEVVRGIEQKDREILRSTQNEESLPELNKIPARVSCSIFSLE